MIPIETKFYKHIEGHFLHLFRIDDFWAMHGVELVSQRLVLLLLEESSPCLPLRRAEWGSLLNLQVVKRCWWKGSINARSRRSVYMQLIIFPVDFNIVQISRLLIPSCVQTFLCTYAWKYFVPHFMCSLLVGEWMEFALDGCSSTVVFETTTSSKLPKEFLGNLLSFLGRDHLQSEPLNLLQIWETTQFWLLRKSCSFTVDWKFKRWEVKKIG